MPYKLDGRIQFSRRVRNSRRSKSTT